MSASLVGSEMCIRDRLSCRSRPQPARSLAFRPPSGPTAYIRSVRGEASVSYTHLTLPTICSV
eukprot:6728778-Alexandrium_andersonii.AAC.1